MIAGIFLSIPRAAGYAPSAPPQNADWDVLYVFAGLVLLILIPVTVAAVMNARDRHSQRF